MAFRADEAAQRGYEKVQRYVISREVDGDKRIHSKNALEDIILKYGPVIDSYPSWHPLVSNHDDRHPVTTPSNSCGYEGLDHTRYFLNGFITIAIPMVMVWRS